MDVRIFLQSTFLKNERAKHRLGVKPSIASFLSLLALGGVLLLTLSFSQAQADAQKMVIFTAKWCATCREVVPMAKQVASQYGLSVLEVNVDDQNAPAQVRPFGLNVPNVDPPQVYWVGNGQVNLVLDGRNYDYGKSDLMQSTLVQNLRRSMGPGALGK
jgi:thiol-disulfide isomerase/thioredoxin